MLADAERVLEELIHACQIGALIGSAAEVAALRGALEVVRAVRLVQ